eukprot:c25479_g1_i1 orf=119-343(+)
MQEFYLKQKFKTLQVNLLEIPHNSWECRGRTKLQASACTACDLITDRLSHSPSQFNTNKKILICKCLTMTHSLW